MGAGANDNGLMLHSLLSCLFGKKVLQPFRLFEPRHGAWSLYAYTACDAKTLNDNAKMAAPPEMLATIKLGQLRSKPMPTIKQGQRLGIDLKLRPVRRRVENKRLRERDAYVVDALHHHADNAKGMKETGRNLETTMQKI